jgi:ubiquinone/menaquinone biosynthesis C-methylase UbiE
MLALFGHNAGLVWLAVFLGLATLAAAAFCQGRPITIGRLSIGARPRASEESAKAPVSAAHTANESALSADPRFGKAQIVFETPEAKQFYHAIARNYDERNSANLLATQFETITRLQIARDAKPSLRVLDLGGGTGQNIATHFFNDVSICWTYVDFCPAMVDQLERHLAGQPMFRNLRRHVADINDVHRILPPGSYDVVLMSLVLSSMPQLPDFTKIARLLAPHGMLIVSDINPLYTERHPYYVATAQDGTVVAMRMRPVDPVEICQRAGAAGLRQPEITWEPKVARYMDGGDISYSFVATFVSAMRPRPYLPLRANGFRGRSRTH